MPRGAGPWDRGARGREPAQERLALTGMSDVLTFILLAAVWIVLQTWILPRLGVST